MILYGRLLHRIKVEDSLWTINKGDRTEVHINLEKTKEIMWKSVFEVYYLINTAEPLIKDPWRGGHNGNHLSPKDKLQAHKFSHIVNASLRRTQWLALMCPLFNLQRFYYRAL